MRINRERLFFMLNDRDGVTEEDLSQLDACPYRNILVFSSKRSSSHRCTFWLPPFDGQSCTGNTALRSWLTGRVMFEDYFDFVGWLNQEKGSSLEAYRLKK